jgi:hypothetical protein
VSKVPNKIRRLLERRPLAREDVQAQLLWIVDVIFACSEGGLLREAAHLRRALGHLGKYLEEHVIPELELAFHELQHFEKLLEDRRRSPR